MITAPGGIRFLFLHDIKEELLTPEQFKKWLEVSAQSTVMLVGGERTGTYLEDVEKFLRLDSEGR